MSTKENKRSLNKIIAISILIVLVIVNATWMIICKYPGPLMALIFYVFVAFLFWRKNDFRAGIIMGIIGLIIHVCELLLQGIADLGRLELVFFFANLLLPIPLIYFSYRAYKEVRDTGDSFSKI